MRTSIEDILLLHYKSFEDDASSSDSSSPAASTCNPYLDSAEVVVFFDEQDSQAVGDVSRITLNCSLPKSPSPIQTLTDYTLQ